MITEVGINTMSSLNLKTENTTLEIQLQHLIFRTNSTITSYGT